MLVFKEKHITYDWTNDNSLVFVKGDMKGKTYNGPIMLYFNKIFAGSKMTKEVAKWNALQPADAGGDVEYDLLKPKYADKFNFPVDNPTDPTRKEIKEGKYKKYFVEYCGDICEVNKWDYKYFKKNSTPYHKAIKKVELELGLSVYDIDKNLAAIAEGRKIIKDLDTRISPTAYMQAIENLNTKGGELEYDDGAEYVGDYHIHPEKGPMVGAYHTDVYHHRLYWTRKTRYVPKDLVP